MKSKLCAALAAVALALSACASAPPPTLAQRLGALFQQAMPLAELLDKVAAGDSVWPFSEQAFRALTPQHKACVRSALSGARAAQRQMDDALAYAKAHPDEVEGAISLLEKSGVAQALGRASRLLASGSMFSALDALRSLDASQFEATMRLLTNPEYRELRKAMRLDWLLAPLTGGGSAGVPAPLTDMLRECQLPMDAFF